MKIQRKQVNDILADLKKKMVIIIGPRQVGKTWIAKEVMTNFTHSMYLNWDNPLDQVVIKKATFPANLELLVLDEIHKMRQWKSYVKGIYDTKPESLQILITGSARLQALKNVGDAMIGRYFTHHIFPLSLAELHGSGHDDVFEKLLERSGFPEPFLANDEVDVARWRNQYVESNIRTEVLNFASAQDLAALADIVKILRIKVGSPLSFKNIADDVGVSSTTVKRYIQILEDVHLVFSVRTYTKKIPRAILKEPKIYFYDVGLVVDDSARLENFVALSLLKHITYLQDCQGKNTVLAYLRTKENKEVDFALVTDDVMQEIIEVKTSDTAPSKTLIYFGERQKVPMTQVVKNMSQRELVASGVRIVRMKEYLEELAL